MLRELSFVCLSIEIVPVFIGGNHAKLSTKLYDLRGAILLHFV